MPTESNHHIRPIAAGCARYIGRVGALAVALGIGAAVATGYGIGVAQADDTATSEKAPSVDASSDSPPPASDDQASQQPAASGSKHPAPAASKDDTSEAGMDVDSSGGRDTSVNDGGQSTDNGTGDDNHVPVVGDVDDRKSDAAKQSSAHHSQAATSPRTVKNPPVSRSEIASVPSPTPTREPFGALNTEVSAPVAAHQSSTFTAVHQPQDLSTAVPTPPVPAPTPTLVTTFVSAVLSPLLTPGPGVPVDPPVVLGLLGWVRNEEQRRYSADSASLMTTALAVSTTPVATKDSATTKEDTAVTVNVLANDTDAEGDSLTTAVVSGPTNGTVVHNADGSFTYTPAANFNGTDTFTYLANDGFTDSAPATVTVKVTAVNDAPVANPDSATTAEDTAVRIDVKANDTDVENNTTTASVVTKPTNGTVTRNTDGTFTYTPKANFAGTDTFTYRLYDGANSNTATVTITVTAVNDVPVAAKDSVSTKEDTAVTINAVANDKDPDGDPLTAAVAIGPANGIVTTNADGTFTYKPNQNFYGTDAFTYTATDGALSSAPVAVTVKIAAVNDAPIANPDTATTAEDTAVVINVKANDTDVENNTTTPSVLTQPANGKVVRNADGTFTYTPKANFAGTDTFTYRLYDGANSNPATVTVTVTAVNDAPTAVNDSATTKEDTTVTVNVLANDKDPDSDALTTAVATGPANGALSHNTDGSFTYTPNQNFYGTDSFTYTVNDGTTTGAAATVTVKVSAVNDAPVANPDTASTTMGTPVVIDVKANDTDVENNTMTPTVLTKPVNGVVVRNADGTFTYTPKADFTGTDTFTYRQYDGANSNTATVTISVNPVGPANHPPTAGNIFFNNVPIPGGSSVVSTVSGDVSDPDGDTLTAAVVDQPTHGSVTMSSDGNFTYVAPNDYTGSDTFTYRVFDGTAYSNTATVTINNIVPANHAPTARDITFNTPLEAGSISVSSVGGDISDPDGDTLTTTIVTPPTHGTVDMLPNGGFTYRSDPSYVGTATFTYKVNDGTLDSNTATVTFNMVAANHAPTAQNISVSMSEDGGLSGVVSTSTTDEDGDPLTASVLGQPAHGTVEFVSAVNYIYRPAANFNGVDSFTYRLFDGAQYSNVATVTITVNPTNDAPVANNDSVSTSEDASVTVNVLANDVDDDGDSLTTTVVTNPAHGTVVHNVDGSFTYTPAANYNGTDTFTYRAADATTGSTATVTVTITPVNDVVVAQNRTVSMSEDGGLSSVVTVSVTDVDGDPLTASVVGQPAHGTVEFVSAVNYIYRPVANYNGTDTFTYRLFDGTAYSNTATVTITINAVNDAPVAVNDTAATVEGTAVTINAAVNDSDIDGDNLTTSLVTNPAHGAVVRNTDGTFTYTPATGYTGTDSFTYGVNDGTVNSNAATVSITINAADTVGVVGSVGLAGGLDSVRYNADGSRAFVVSTVKDSLDRVTSTRVAVVDTATGATLATPITLSGQIVDININDARAGIISTVSNGGTAFTTTLTTLDVATGQTVRTQTFNGSLASIQRPNDATAVLATRVQTSPTSAPITTVSFVDTYTGTLKGDTLTFTGDVYDIVFGRQGHAVIAYNNQLDNRAYVAVFNTIDGLQRDQTRILPGSLGRPETMTHNAFLIDPPGANPATAVIVTNSGGQGSPIKTNLTTIDLDTGLPISTQVIDDRVHTVQIDEATATAYVITDVVTQLNVVTNTRFSAINTTTGTQIGTTLTVAGQYDNLAINATHNRAVFTYTDTTGAAHMAVIDTATATQTGQTINLPGQSTNNLILTNDGTQAAIITTANNKGTLTTTITTINLGNDEALEI